MIVLGTKSPDTKIFKIAFYAVPFVIILCATLISVSYIPCDSKLTNEEEVYSWSLVNINDVVEYGVTIPDNIYVIKKHDGDYVFYSKTYANEKIKRAVEKDNIVITNNNGVAPFEKVCEETYVETNVFGEVVYEYTTQKSYLTIPTNAVISDSLLTLT